MCRGWQRNRLLALLVVVGGTSAAYGVESKVDDIAFRASVDGTEQRYAQILPADFDSRQEHDVLFALHGHGSDRWQYVRDERAECQAARDIATNHHMIFISPDYRAPASWMGPLAEADLLQIIADVKVKYRVRQVIVSGGSMGGTGSLTFAALHPRLVNGVVALNGTANLVEYDQFQDAIQASFGGTKQERAEEYKRRSAEYRPEALTMPIACTTGGQDTIVPPDSVVRLLSVLREKHRPALLIHREQGEHSTNYDDAVEAYEFVLEKLEKQRKPYLGQRKA